MGAPGAARGRTAGVPHSGGIAEVAIGIADREGFAAVTMRKVATELGVAPMAAYRHVNGKDELWALMIDRVSGELEPVAEVSGWRETLSAYALRTREMMLRHPWLAHMRPRSSPSRRTGWRPPNVSWPRSTGSGSTSTR